MMTESHPQTGSTDRIVKIAFGVMAILCLLTGLALYLFADSFGFAPDTARYVAIAFLVVGVTDYIVLRFWDRLMKRR